MSQASLIRIKNKGQITIPAQVRRRAHAKTGDVFEVSVDDGNIILKPQQVVSRHSAQTMASTKGVDIGQWIGSAKGLFSSTADVDAFIASERKQWN